MKYEFCLHLTVVSYEPLEYVFSEQLRITPGSGVLKTPETWVILTAIIGVSSTPDGRGFANPYNGGPKRFNRVTGVLGTQIFYSVLPYFGDTVGGSGICIKLFGTSKKKNY